MYCVYEHIRLDTNTPFYIGKGSRKRAFVKRGRNIWWKGIVKKTEYKVRILKYFQTEQESLDFEYELQVIYSCLGYKLCNMARCGGQGPIGNKHSEEAKEKIKAASLKLWSNEDHVARMKQLKHSEETKIKIGEASKKLWKNEEHVEKMKEKHAGENNAFSDKTKYKFSHPIHGEIECTQSHLRIKYKTSKNIGRVVSGERYSLNGWMLSKHKDHLPGYDNTIISWRHEFHEDQACKRSELIVLFPHLRRDSIGRVARGEYEQTQGWRKII